MTDASAFTKFMPGFDFLQTLVSNAGAALPGVGQWIVPTLDPAELEKRINELRTVQFWLDQNSRMLSTTIQALEVQRMTLSTLRGMNVSMNELQAGLQARATASPPPSRSPKAAPAAPNTASTGSTPPPEAEPPADEAAEPGAGQPKPVVDPMQWWGSLTEQFSKLAADAMRQASDVTGPAAAAAAAAVGEAAAAAVPPVPRKAKPAAKTPGRPAPDGKH